MPREKLNDGQQKLFWYWMNERHRIYEARKNGKARPWTKDTILHTYKFTNVFRQLDRTTIEWTNRYVTLLGRGRSLSDGDVLFQCAMFRLFNWPATYDALYYGMRSWSMKLAMRILESRASAGEKIFTGAYIIPNAGREDPKIQVICEALDALYKVRTRLARRIRKCASMEKACRILQKIPTIGPFIAYEIACDLRHTRILSHARDILSWANPGPGAKRGIHRLKTGKAKWPKNTPRPDYVRCMRFLLERSRSNLGKHVLKAEWPLEMREIEHSLCEFDKYMRVKNKEGRPRSKYAPALDKTSV